jgi:hypothetical protein
VNYAYGHTTATAGGTVFYSECSRGLQAPFELRQDNDLLANAATIDAGSMTYIFTGHIQNPVSNQTDTERFYCGLPQCFQCCIGNNHMGWQS